MRAKCGETRERANMKTSERTAQLRARCVSDLVIASGRALAVTRLELRPEVGTPQTVDLFRMAIACRCVVLHGGPFRAGPL